MGNNKLLQYISSAVRETLISNLYSVPTDCPQRSEGGVDGGRIASAKQTTTTAGDMYYSINDFLSIDPLYGNAVCFD